MTHTLRLGALLAAPLAVASLAPWGLPAQPSDPAPVTTLVILGVEHAAQLVGRAYHPGYFRAFFDRLRPAAICIERSPEEFARGDYYEFTHEVQHIAVPYARTNRVELCPIDWLPSRDDERLAFGRLEVVELPAVRQPRGFQGFLVLDSTALRRTLFYADSAQDRAVHGAWYDKPRAEGWSDFPRRLGLYRTFMQAMRIRAAARAHAGDTVLVVVGSMHKDDIERVLTGDAGIRVVQPSALAATAPADADRQLTTTDLYAIATFNLLGVQPTLGPVDWAWVGDVLDRLERAAGRTPEVRLLRTRHSVLRGTLAPDDAIASYGQIAQQAQPAARFTFTGVEDARRIDSYFDPFGNLGVRQRAVVEQAREQVRAGRTARARELRRELLASGSWPPLRRAQLLVYWQRYITPDDG